MSEEKKPFQLYDKQWEAFQAFRDYSKDTVVFAGGVGGGKTKLGAFALLKNGFDYPGSRWLLGRKRLIDLKATILPDLFELAEEFNVTNRLHHHKQQNYIEFNNGKGKPKSHILLKALEMKPSDPENISLGSLNLTGAVLEEAGELEKDIFRTMHERLRHKTDFFGITGKVMIITNPTQNWLYHDFYLPWERGELDSSKAFIQAGPFDNPFLPESYIKKNLTRENLGEYKYQTRVLMNWHYSAGDVELFETDIMNDAFYRDRGEINTRTNYITVDVAGMGKDKSIICLWNGWDLLEIKTFDVITYSELAKKIMKLASENNVGTKHIAIDCNGGYGMGVAEYIKGCYIYKGTRSALNKEGYFHLRDQCYYQLAKRFREGKIKISCHHYMDEIITELKAHKRYQIERDSLARVTPNEIVRQSLSKSPDIADAMAIRVVYDYVTSKPVLDLL